MGVSIENTKYKNNLEGPQLPLCSFMTCVNISIQGRKKRIGRERKGRRDFQAHTIRFLMFRIFEYSSHCMPGKWGWNAKTPRVPLLETN